jgi:hypothetical protein
MPPVPIPETDLFAEPTFAPQNNSTSLEQPQPTSGNGAVLDENERKAFSQFLDSFCGDQNMQFDPHQFSMFDHPPPPPPMSLDPYHDDEHRQNSILQSLDERKRYYNGPAEEAPSYKQADRPVYLQQSSAISPPYIKPVRESSTCTKSTPVVHSTCSTTTTTSKEPSGGGAVRRGKPHKELLSEEEKRSNHIASEQKRRGMIRSGFKDLTEIVPTLKNINNSKSTVLFKAVDYIKYLEKRNKNLREKIKNLEIRVEVEGRMGALGHHDMYKGSSNTNAALLQHKTQQKQLMELQEKLQLHQRLLAQQQHHQQQKGGYHYMFDHPHHQDQTWLAAEATVKDTKMEVDATTSGEPLKATVSA